MGYLSFDVSDGEVSSTVVLSITPGINYLLKVSETDPDFEVQARESGSGDPFVDIGATPINLSSHTPETPVDYDFRIVTNSPLIDVRRVAVHLAVSSDGAAGW